ncbi:MAG: glycosyltransferase family 39 protein [bacterium]
MNNKNRFLCKIPIVTLALIGAVGILILTNLFGAGVAPDSVAYVSVARHVSQGFGFVNFDGYSFILQPPLYPLILAAIKMVFFIDPLISAGYLNAILFGLIIFYSGLFLLTHLKSYWLAIFGTITILGSSVLITISLITFSEPLFILLILLYLHFFDIYIKKRTITSLILFSIAVSLACLTRYVGVIIILTGSISIFIWAKKTFKETFKHLIIFLLITILPTGLWILRNYFISGTLVGQRAESSFTISDNLILFFNTIIKWYLPWQISGQQLFFLIVLVSVVIFDRVVLMNRWNKEKSRMEQIYPPLIFIILYSVIIVISSTTTAYDKIDNRLLSPIYVTLLFCIYIILDNILDYFSKQFNKKIVTALLIIGIIIWMKYPVNRTIYYVDNFIKHSGWEYSSKEWEENSVIVFLNNNQQLIKGYSIYSNAPEAVYILANMEAKWSPPKTMYNSSILINTNIIPQNIYFGEDKAILIWFYNLNRNFLFKVDELQKYIKIVKIVQLKDGEIYTIKKNN